MAWDREIHQELQRLNRNLEKQNGAKSHGDLVQLALLEKPKLLEKTDPISLTTAATDTRLAISGNYLRVENLTGVMSIKFNERDYESFDLFEGRVFKFPKPFYQVFYTNEAQSGCSATFVYGWDAEVVTSSGPQRRNIVVAIATATSGAIAKSITPTAQFKLLSVTLHLNIAGTTSENFTVTLNAGDGAVYDTVFLKQDLSVGSVTDLVWSPDNDEGIFESDDVIDVAWPNTEARTYGLRIVYELV